MTFSLQQARTSSYCSWPDGPAGADRSATVVIRGNDGEIADS